MRARGLNEVKYLDRRIVQHLRLLQKRDAIVLPVRPTKVSNFYTISKCQERTKNILQLWIALKDCILRDTENTNKWTTTKTNFTFQRQNKDLPGEDQEKVEPLQCVQVAIFDEGYFVLSYTEDSPQEMYCHKKWRAYYSLFPMAQKKKLSLLFCWTEEDSVRKRINKSQELLVLFGRKWMKRYVYCDDYSFWKSRSCLSWTNCW